MTYCVGLRLDRGIVFASDTRTNAGVDNISIFSKMHVFEKPGDRVLVLLSAGNLSLTQSVVSLLQERLERTGKDAPPSLWTAPTMFRAARVVGDTIREVMAREKAITEEHPHLFTGSFIFGGQVEGDRPRLFLIYQEGNFIEATVDTPFFQIGEHKYGKPILDRVARADMRMGAGAKLLLLSFDSTIRSNLSVGLPIDLLIYRTDRLAIDERRRIEADDPYFRHLSSSWSEALRESFQRIHEYDDPRAPGRPPKEGQASPSAANGKPRVEGEGRDATA